MFLRRSRLAALLAVLAMALQAFWPLLAQARPRIAGELVPVCTVDGVTHYLELPAGKSPLDERSASHEEHCKLCVFGADKGVALALTDAHHLADPGFVSETIVFLSAPPPEPLTHLPAKPRAPPCRI